MRILSLILLTLLIVPFASAEEVTVEVLVYCQGDGTEWKGSVLMTDGVLTGSEAYHWENQFESQLPHQDRWLEQSDELLAWESQTDGDSDGVLFSAQLDENDSFTVRLNRTQLRTTPSKLLQTSPRFEDVEGDARVILVSCKRRKESHDSDNDGDPDELIIEETARRARGRSGEFDSPGAAASAPLFPIAVRVVDDDDDMQPDDIVGDRDSDAWFADWDADGSVDRLVDWIDNDGDNDADEMDIRYFRNGELIWGWFWEDLDDDNQMWSASNYEYREAFASDMYGDNIFWLQKYNPINNTWIPYSECPFSFYDLDDDGLAEAVVRVSAVPSPEHNANSYDEIWGPNPVDTVRVSNVRYSFDLDNDSTPENRLDYDFGFTLVCSLPYEGYSYTNPLRRPPRTMQRIAHDRLLGVADNITAEQTGFSWDEFDRNHRWEGIFWSELDWVRIPLPNAGGPTYRWNMRREFDSQPRSQRQLYYSEIDQRIHCFGASVGWIEHGYMWSEEKLGETKFFDTDGDGFFDRWEVNLDNRGSPERVTTDAQNVQMLPWDWNELHRFYTDLLPRVVSSNLALISTIKSLGISSADTILPRAVERLEENFESITSVERQRYVSDLLREYYFHALLVRLQDTIDSTSHPERRARLHSIRSQLDKSYGMGYNEGVLTLLAGLEDLPKPETPQSKDLIVRITNPAERARDGVPVVLSLDEIQKHAPDFGTGPLRVVDKDGTILPSQVDDPDGDSLKDAVAFQVSLAPNESRDVTIRYGDLDVQQPYTPRVFAQAGEKFHFSWESDATAFRTYFGKIDVFGKTQPCLFMRDMEAPWVNTHDMSPRGMDILNVGATSGLGGMNVWHDGKPYQADSYGAPGNRVIRSEPHFRILANGPVRVLAEIDQPNWRVGDRRFHATLYVTIWAGQRHCTIRTHIESLDGEPFEFGPGMTIVGEEGRHDSENRILWCWGDQDIGAGEIGLGVLYPSESLVGIEEGEGEMLARYASDGESEMETAIAGGWTRDWQFMDGEDWLAFLRELREEIETPVEVEIMGAP